MKKNKTGRVRSQGSALLKDHKGPRVVTRYTVAKHPQAAELRQWLLRTVRNTDTNGTNTQVRA